MFTVPRPVSIEKYSLRTSTIPCSILSNIFYFSCSIKLIFCLKRSSNSCASIQKWSSDNCSGVTQLQLTGKRKYKSKAAQSSSSDSTQLNKSFFCRFWHKQSLSGDIYPKSGRDVPPTVFSASEYHHHKRRKLVERIDGMAFLLPLLFRPASMALCLCGKLSGRFLNSFHNHFQGRNPLSMSSTAVLLPSSHCAHCLFFQPRSGSTPTKAAGSKKSVLQKTPG